MYDIILGTTICPRHKGKGKGKFTLFKDGAYYCYCAYVLRISRYSDFLSPILTNTLLCILNHFTNIIHELSLKNALLSPIFFLDFNNTC